MAEDTALSGVQDTTDAQGTASNGLMSTMEPVATEAVEVPTFDSGAVTADIDQNVDFSGDYINKDNSTVAGQLSALLSSDSPYIQEARRSALETSSSRGLQNSTIASGAGERAAIQSALPIAAQDASTYAQSDLATQGATQALQGQVGSAIVQGGLNEQDYSFQGTQNAFNRAHELSIQTNNFEQQTAMEQMQENHETIQADLDRLQQDKILSSQQGHEEKMADISYGYNKSLQDIQIASTEMMDQKNWDYQQARDFQSMSTQILHDYQTDVTTLISDMNFLEASAGDINSALESLSNIAKNNVQFAGSMAGIPSAEMNSYLANAFG